MKKIFFVISLIVLSQSILDQKYPDAIRCGVDNDGSIFVVHNLRAGAGNQIYYCQALGSQNRCVVFSRNGTDIIYKIGYGDYSCRKGCQNKSFSTLDKQGRTIYYALYSKKQGKLDEETFMKNKIQKLEAEIEGLKRKQLSVNFWDYQQIKKKWEQDFEKNILSNIKSKGLQIGSRWKLQQEETDFVIRDLEGSKKKDSRISFASQTKSNPK